VQVQQRQHLGHLRGLACLKIAGAVLAVTEDADDAVTDGADASDVTTTLSA